MVDRKGCSFWKVTWEDVCCLWRLLQRKVSSSSIHFILILCVLNWECTEFLWFSKMHWKVSLDADLTSCDVKVFPSFQLIKIWHSCYWSFSTGLWHWSLFLTPFYFPLSLASLSISRWGLKGGLEVTSFSPTCNYVPNIFKIKTDLIK